MPPLRPYLFRLLSFVIVLWLAGGCEMVVEMDPPSYDPELVIFSEVSPGGSWEVQIRHSVPVGASESIHEAIVTNAEVEVLQHGAMIARPSHTEAGLYRASTPAPAAGETYMLRVSASGFETATAESRVPPPVEGLEIFAITEAESGHQQGLSEVRLRFMDASEEATYYRLRVRARYPDDEERPVQFRSSDPILQDLFFDPERGETWNTEAVFSDRRFEDHEVTLSLEFNVHDGAEMWISLSRLSEAYYHYLRSLEEMQRAGDNPFTEPVRLASNVEGGLGVFVASNEVRVLVE